MAMTGMRNAGRMAQKRAGRAVAKAALLLAAAGALLLCGAPSLAFAPTIGRPVVQDRLSADGKDGGDADRTRKSKKAADAQGQPNAAAAAAPESDRLAGDGHDAAPSPKWAMCFVEHEEEAGSSVLEEFVLRADRDNMEAFHAWQHGAGAEKTMCVEDSAPAEGTMCIECLAHASAMSYNAPDGSAPAASVSTQLIDTFTGLEECVRATFDGSSFCKSGRVVVPA